MANENLVTVYLGKEDADLKEELKNLDNKARAEIAKAAMRLYFARKQGNPGKPWIAPKGWTHVDTGVEK